MTPRARLWVAAFCAGAIAVAVGCGALLDLPDNPTFVNCFGDCPDGAAEPNDGALPDGTTVGGGDGGDVGDACGLTQVDDDAGVFVLLGGLDAGTNGGCPDAAANDGLTDASDEAETSIDDAAPPDACVPTQPAARGTRQNPCTSLQEGLDLAHSNRKPIVFVAGGTYTESLHLYGGASVIGAWKVAGDAWTRACDDPLGEVVVQAPDTQTTVVLADTLDAPTTLAAMSLKSKATIAPGESLYGVLARGTTTALTLNYVFVDVITAGGGAIGGTGKSGVTANGCTSSGNGASVTTPGAAGVPASAGTFDTTGYHPGNGQDGQPGASGQNGSLGGKGTCVACVKCSKVAGVCTASSAPQACGAEGLAGCGGGGGASGHGGGGGGGSFALFAWGANVTVLGGKLHAGNGGIGGVGGGGGPSGPPGNGAPGPASAPCGSSCSATGPCVPTNDQSGQGGAPGTAGGAGAAGGAGGGGAGGAACASYRGAGGVVTLTNPILAFGPAGTGAGGAPDGIASFECQ